MLGDSIAGELEHARGRGTLSSAVAVAQPNATLVLGRWRRRGRGRHERQSALTDGSGSVDAAGSIDEAGSIDGSGSVDAVRRASSQPNKHVERYPGGARAPRRTCRLVERRRGARLALFEQPHVEWRACWRCRTAHRAARRAAHDSAATVGRAQRVARVPSGRRL